MPQNKRISLDGDGWWLGQCMHGQGIDDVVRWTPAVVPGEVRVDLLRAGIIEDPFPGKQNELSRWVDDWNWWYRRDVDIPQGPRRTFFRFEGIDYKSHIFFNGRRICDNEGMFAPVVVEVTELLAGRNTLAVNIEYSGQFRVRENTLKCQMGFGWDFAPAIKTMGIWDSVSMIRTGDVYIRHLRVEPVRVTEFYWEAQLTVGLDSRKEVNGVLDFKVLGDNFDCKPVSHRYEINIPVGLSEHRIALPMPDPQLWSPWEEGKQNLYRLEANVLAGKTVSDGTSTRFGMRTAKLHSNEGRHEDIWTFIINGERIFIRGANWVPADSMPGRLDRERYSKLLKLAKQANINMLRVWGGGLREKAEFYDLCDELGILVWQEFPFACGHRPYPRDAKFKKLVKKEADGILDKIHNNPSVVLYCGGNEISYSMNKPIVDILAREAQTLGGGRPFKVSSPTKGESHNYRVYHGLANVAEYKKEEGSFLSEFGMQSVPVRDTLDFIIPRKNQWPIAPEFPYALGEYTFNRAEKFDFINRLIISSAERRNTELWTYHDAQMTKLFRYAEQIGFDNCETFIDATQRMQAYGLQVAVEHIRRRKFEASGVMFWQFNEPWPTVSWSVVDYFLRPKAAYHKLKQIYSPLLFSLDYPLGPYEPDQTFTARAYLINDRHREYGNLKVDIDVLGPEGETTEHFEREVPRAAADSITELESVPVTLRGDGGWKIKCAVSQNKKILSRNEYDLTIVDKKPTVGIMMAADWLMHNIFWK